MMLCIKAFFTILAAQALVEASTTTAAPTATDDGKKFKKSSKSPKSCKADTEFEWSECGKGDDTICCDTKAACLTVKNKVGTEWKDQYYCSINRGMTNSKLMKIVLMPLVLFTTAILFVVLMVLNRPICRPFGDIKGNHVTKCCVAVIAVAWPLFLSQYWVYGAYSCIVALFVSFASQSTTTAALFPWWVYRLAWAMSAFMVVQFLGPTEAFHVPFYNQSLAGKSTDLFNKVLGATEATCNTHYDKYFKLTSIEMKAKGANPSVKYFGLCTNGWLNFVQIILLVQAFLWFATLLVSSPVFLVEPTQAKGMAKVEPETEDLRKAAFPPPEDDKEGGKGA